MTSPSRSPRIRRRKEDTRVEPRSTSPRRPLFRRVPWTAVVITILVLLSASFAVEPLRDAATLQTVPEARLDLSPGYIALAPVSSVLDTLTLFGLRQHVALLVSLLVLYLANRAWRIDRTRRAMLPSAHAPPRAVPRVSGLLRELGLLALFLVAIVVAYAAALVLPRPTAAIVLADPELYLAADFHSHTQYSHDGRPGWSAEDVRAWHRAAGFDMAYISDHRTVEGAERGIADNPRQAGQGTMLLQALEVGYRGEHVNVLGAGRVYKGLTTADNRDIDERALTLASLLGGREPILIETLPGHPAQIPFAGGEGGVGVRAIEVIDGSPRGLDQTRLQRSRILHLADSANLAIVAGSDNHGWGMTAPGWTLLRIPGWRGMGTDSLAFAVERALRVGRGATRVVERRVAGELNESNLLELALTLPSTTWRMWTTLSSDERVMWLVWVWTLVLVARLAARRRRLPASVA